jgi:hypothetical protein
MATLVTALFRNATQAEAAVDALIKRGYTRDDISVVMSDATKSKQIAIVQGNKAAEGTGIGSAVGGVVGATIAAIAAVGTSLALPGLGLVIAGPIAAALAGAGAGGATGGIIGALVGAGIPEHRAAVYDAGLKEGGILVGVEGKSKEDSDQIEELLENLGGEGIRQV